MLGGPRLGWWSRLTMDLIMAGIGGSIPVPTPSRTSFCTFLGSEV